MHMDPEHPRRHLVWMWLTIWTMLFGLCACLVLAYPLGWAFLTISSITGTALLCLFEDPLHYARPWVRLVLSEPRARPMVVRTYGWTRPHHEWQPLYVEQTKWGIVVHRYGVRHR